MSIFAQKHFTRRRTNLLGLMINGSIYLSAAGAIVMRFLRRALLLMLDVLFLYPASWVLDRQFIHSYQFIGIDGLDAWLFNGTVLLICFGLSGAYDLPLRLFNVVKGAALATLVFLVYVMWRLDPGLAGLSIIVGGAVIMSGVASRLLLHLIGIRSFSLRTLDRKRVLAVGSAEENYHALALLWQTHFGLGRQEQMPSADAALPDAPQRMRKLIRKQGIDEVVFCAKDLQWGRIIELIEQLESSGAMFKIAQPAREFIIGPSSIESVQDLLILEEYAVNSAAARRRKRILDLSLSLALLITLPISIWFIHDKGGFVRNLFSVTIGRRSWVGYFPMMDKSVRLPRIRLGVLDPIRSEHLSPVPLTVQRVNLSYAKDYRVWQDLRLVWKGFPELGN